MRGATFPACAHGATTHEIRTTASNSNLLRGIFIAPLVRQRDDIAMGFDEILFGHRL
jgi:hypothetical protein